MSLSYKLIFAALACSTVVLAGPGGRHGHGGGFGGQGGQRGSPQLPPFLQNVTSEGRRAFFAIVTNTSATIGETETAINTWAQTYGVSNEVTEFGNAVEAKLAELKANVTAVLNNIPTVQTQLEAIFANKSQTIREQLEAIHQLKQQYPQEVGALFFIAKPKGGFQGGFPGSNQGLPDFGGNQGGNQGGFPGFPGQGGNQGGFPEYPGQGGNQGGFGGFGGQQGGNQGGFPGGNQGGFGGQQGGNQGGFGGFGGQQGGRGRF